MDTTTIRLHSGFPVGTVDPRVFGGFLEHIGRAVYEGVYQPGSAHADGHGLRTDVVAALKGLGFSLMRYPGGNFVSGYHWLNGIGPVAGRPTVRDMAWQSVETNEFGTEEYMHLCRAIGCDPMLAVNLGTGTPEEARNWVEYCNCPPGTQYADKRVEAGSPKAHDVRLWCLGNEMDGPWQIGHVPAVEYALRAQQAAKIMKDTDRRLELVVCGTCVIDLPTYIEWDRQVLEHVGDYADYISLHRYVGNKSGDLDDYLAVTAGIDRQIEEMDAVCRTVQARRRSAKRTYLCFDEWNVWYKNMEMDGAGKKAPHLIEEVYDLADALVVAGFLNSFLRHADVVKIANLAQCVNVIAPLLTIGDRLLVQSTYHSFQMYSKRRTGISLRTSVEGPRLTGKTNGTVPLIDTAAILDGNRLSVFLVNRSAASAAPVRIEMADHPTTAVRDAEILTGPGAGASNSLEKPDLVAARPFDGWKVSGGTAAAQLPPLSVAAVTFTVG